MGAPLGPGSWPRGDTPQWHPQPAVGALPPGSCSFAARYPLPKCSGPSGQGEAGWALHLDVFVTVISPRAALPCSSPSECSWSEPPCRALLHACPVPTGQLRQGQQGEPAAGPVLCRRVTGGRRRVRGTRAGFPRRAGVASCQALGGTVSPPGGLPVWDRGAVGIGSRLWAVGGVGTSSRAAQAGRPDPGPAQRVSSTLTEPQRLFPGRPVKRRAGLLAFTGPVAFQEDSLGDQPGVAGGHPGLGLPGLWGLLTSSLTCRAAREAAEARERREWPRPHGEVVSGPSDWGRRGPSGTPSCPWREETRGSSWVAKSGAGLCSWLAPVTLGRLLNPQNPGLIFTGGGGHALEASLWAGSLSGWCGAAGAGAASLCLQVPLLQPGRARLTPVGATPGAPGGPARSVGPRLEGQWPA